MALCSRKRSVVTLEKKLEVVAMLKTCFKVTGIFKIMDTTWSHDSMGVHTVQYNYTHVISTNDSVKKNYVPQTPSKNNSAN